MVDFNKKIRNSNKFREPALQFIATGHYCQYPVGTTEYFQYWDTQMERSKNGYTADDGDYISGYNYFYLNFCPIQRIVYKQVTGTDGTVKIKKTRELQFPDFYDYDYYFFTAVQQAEDEGKHLCALKSRRKGYSYKNAAMACRNYYLIPNSKTYIYASNKQYLTEDGILTKAWDYIDFIDKHTAWGKKRSVNTQMRKRAGFFTKDEYGNEIEGGYKSEIIGVTLKDNPQNVRGKAGKLIIFEEAGSFSELGAAWEIARPSVEQDGVAFGLMIAFGCVCAGTKVWTADGRCVSVEDLKQQDGIMGWDTYAAYPQNISNLNPPSEKQCLRITTHTGRMLECSIDHPLLWSTPGKTKRVPGKRQQNEHMKSWMWHRADLCKVGEQVAVIDEIPYFGKEKMWEPRLVGWLIGDGSYGKDKTPVLSNCENSINSYVFENFDTRIERSHITKDGKNYYETRIKGICKKLRELGIYGQTKDKKTLPVDIDKYDADSLSELIGGLYDTDGYIRIDKDGRVRIVLTQAYDTMLKQLQLLLIKFGIKSTISYIKYKDENKHISNGRIIRSKNGEYRLEINDITSVCKFADRIPLKVEHKQSALDLIFIFAQNHINKYNKYLCGIHAERIIKIEDIGIKPIYNLTAKEQNNYIANGIVTHNTGGDEDSNFYALKDMFYNPEGYNCLGFDNTWDETPSDKQCGFFIPQYTNMDFRDKDGRRIYMDEDGNTLKKKSLEYILEERRKVVENATNSVAIDRYVAEHCLDGNTWISTEDGVTRIKDNHKAWISGIKDVYKLVTEDGAELLLTNNHKIFDGKQYKELKDYKVGDLIKYYNTEFSETYQHVSVPGLIPATNTSILIDEDWGRFLGLFMGDGYFYGPSGSIGLVFDKQDRDSIQWAEAFFNLNFGSCSKTEIGKLKGGIELRVSRKGSIEIFKALQLLRSNSNGSLMRKVHVPEYILKSPKSVVSAFLSGLFDSDGYSSKDGNHVGFFSKEKQVLLDMQFLLRGFDIHASVKSRKSVNGNGYEYIENKLNIRKVDIPKFREQIGFISSRKNEHIKDTKPSKVIRDYSYGKITSIEYVKTEEVWDINTITHALSANGIWVHNCITPSEACLEFNGNIFPKKELQEQLAKIRTNKNLSNHKQIGDLLWVDGGKLSWSIKPTGDITHYPLKKDDDPTGSIVIWEHPVIDAPFGLYIIGVDPYDHDQSGTNSLGSCLVYKRFQSFESYYDVIVAEYTGRPSSAEEFYENVRKLCIYYNGRIMYENQNKGLFSYFTAKHCDYLLADQPDIINDVVGDSKVQRKKGCHMNKQIKLWGEGLIKDWLNEEQAPGKKNLHNILSEPLLEELIGYNDKVNADRVMALMQVMIYREQLYNVTVKENKEENKHRVLFDGPIFTQEWFRDDGDFYF